jgi:hypothetical protein
MNERKREKIKERQKEDVKKKGDGKKTTTNLRCA